MARLTRAEYAARHGPTTGDRIRLEDTNLFARVERDETSYGDELLRGWAKTLRTGIIRDQPTAESELDHRDNTIGADPVLGIVKANIGGEGRPHRGSRPGGEPGHRRQPRPSPRHQPGARL